MDTTIILAFSSLPWDALAPWPGELLVRLAEQSRIIFIDPPIYDSAADEGTYKLETPLPNLTLCRIYSPIRATGFQGKMLPSFTGTMNILLRDLHIERYVAWLSTPLVLPIFQNQNPTLQYVTYAIKPLPQAIIYEYSSDTSAISRLPELISRNIALLRTADLIITTNPKIYQEKHAQNQRIHLVDYDSAQEHTASFWDTTAQQIAHWLEELAAK